MHSIYVSDFSDNIYRIDSVDTSPANPVLLVSNHPAGIGGISINANLDSVAGPETMYFVSGPGLEYYYWNGSGWTYTLHSGGGSATLNPGGTYDYIFSLDPVDEAVYRYDGTANGILVLSNANIGNNAVYDLATDNQGNFYIYYTNPGQIMVYNSGGIPIDSFTTSGGPIGGGGGFAILGNRMYVAYATDLYEGIKTGNNINFTIIKAFAFSISDVAVCLEAASPLSVPDDFPPQQTMIYPNPFSDKMNVFINDNKESEIILYDITSRKVLQQTFFNAVTLNTGMLAKGSYYYEVKNKNGITRKGKVIRQ